MRVEYQCRECGAVSSLEPPETLPGEKGIEQSTSRGAGFIRCKLCGGVMDPTPKGVATLDNQRKKQARRPERQTEPTPKSDLWAWLISYRSK